MIKTLLEFENKTNIYWENKLVSTSLRKNILEELDNRKGNNKKYQKQLIVNFIMKNMCLVFNKTIEKLWKK